MTVPEVDSHFFSRGGDSLVIDLSMHRYHRSHLVDSVIKAGLDGDAIILQGGGELPVYNTDTVWDFKQESNFQYLFGAKEPGLFGVITINPAKSYLFIPRLPKEYAQWMGPIKSTEWFKSTYLMDNVFFADEMESVLKNELNVQKLMWYDFVNLDSGLALPQPVFEGSASFKFVKGPGFAHILNELRLVKTDPEISILQYTNDVSCRAHIETMKAIYQQEPRGVVDMEHFAETHFRYKSGLGGCARTGYHCIACSGINNSILHYGHAAEPNNQVVPADSLRLLDMGAEYHCYTADVTVTFPTSGKFTDEQKTIYEAVWKAVLAVESKIKPGIDYCDMHRLAMSVLVQELKRTTNIFVGDVDELIQKNVAIFFCPHGLGHNLGLDVHDVGGCIPGEQKNKLDLTIKGLRLARQLKKGMVITVEPGIYFIDYLLEELRSDLARSALINWPELERYRSVGGIRIEDNVVITDDGCRVLTDVPRTIADIEAVMSGKMEWKVGKHYREYHNC